MSFKIGPRRGEYTSRCPHRNRVRGPFKNGKAADGRPSGRTVRRRVAFLSASLHGRPARNRKENHV
jgi:hypothetical protein